MHARHYAHWRQFYYLEGHVHTFAVRTFCPNLLDLTRSYLSHHSRLATHDPDELPGHGTDTSRML